MWGPPCTHQPLHSAPSGEHSQLPMCLSAGDTGLSVDRESPGPQGGKAQGDRTTCLLNRPHPQAAASWGGPPEAASLAIFNFLLPSKRSERKHPWALGPGCPESPRRAEAIIQGTDLFLDARRILRVVFSAAGPRRLLIPWHTWKGFTSNASCRPLWPLVQACRCLWSQVQGRRWSQRAFPRLQGGGGSGPLLSPPHVPSSPTAQPPFLGPNAWCAELLTASRPSLGAGIFRDLSLRREAKRMNLKREKCQREALWTLNLRRARDLLPQPSSP